MEQMSLQVANFNSIKVRLRLSAAISAAGGLLFQFHKGSIKTSMNFSSYLIIRSFQFHKGSIKTLEDAGYNPQLAKFQFHKGSIKTHRLNGSRVWRVIISIP